MSDPAQPTVMPRSEQKGLTLTEDFARQYPLRVLVAENDYTTRRVIRMVLQRLGYQPTTVECGADCLNAALKDKFDVILSDVDTPEMDAFECARNIRQAGRNPQIVAMSTNTEMVKERQCRNAGITSFLTKPFNVDALQHTLSDAWDALHPVPPGFRGASVVQPLL